MFKIILLKYVEYLYVCEYIYNSIFFFLGELCVLSVCFITISQSMERLE